MKMLTSGGISDDFCVSTQSNKKQRRELMKTRAVGLDADTPVQRIELSYGRNENAKNYVEN
jgi:hypothetical protein